jgi:hypothetical protein
MYIDVRTNICGNSRRGNVNSHLGFVLCWFYIVTVVVVVVVVIVIIIVKQIYWAQLSRFHLKTETEYSLREVMF